MVTIEEFDKNKHDTTTTKKDKVEEFNDLMKQMSVQKEKWDKEAKDSGVEADETDRLLSNAIEFAIEQGRGWKPGEKEAYLERILADDFIPPMFATSVEEVENSGLQEAFTTLIYDGESPTRLMLQFRTKGNDAFANGKRNRAKNQQYFRDAITHYTEAAEWAKKIQPMRDGDFAQLDTDDPTYTIEQLNQEKATIHANIALMHWQLKNWGLMRDEAKKALQFDKTNLKACFRLAKALEMLKEWEDAGDAIETGLALDNNNADLRTLQKKLHSKISQARTVRQQRERARAERVSRIKDVWNHCRTYNIQLGRVPLVASVTDNTNIVDEIEDAEKLESRWHHHRPNTGLLPKQIHGEEWVWPVMFLYPSHRQSDFIKDMGENEMIGLKMAELFPELDDLNDRTTLMPWDFNNEFTCSQLAVYFEVHGAQYQQGKYAASDASSILHPDQVEPLKTQATCMRFYESSRALLGDEGPEMADVVQAVERKHLYKLQQAWKQTHKTLHAQPDPCPVVRVHPAMTLTAILQDARMIVPNFLVTFFLLPEKHPAHEAFLKERNCLGVLQPKET